MSRQAVPYLMGLHRSALETISYFDHWCLVVVTF
jgi:hypothetical protein